MWPAPPDSTERQSLGKPTSDSLVLGERMGDMVTVEDPRVTCTNGRDQKSWMEMDETTAGVLAEPHQEYLTVGGQWT